MGIRLVVSFFVLVGLSGHARGHAYINEPPARGFITRAPGISAKLKKLAVKDNDVQGWNCGGAGMQWHTNGGKCGVCGENYLDTNPANQAGGKFASGVIGRHYKKGSYMPVEVTFTAYHKGWFEFRICPNNDITKRVSEDCLSQHKLFYEDGAGQVGDRYYCEDHLNDKIAGGQNSKFVLRVMLPSDMVCSQCVIQWYYRAGNNWRPKDHPNPDDGQESFVSCADVKISEQGPVGDFKGEMGPSGGGTGVGIGGGGSITMTTVGMGSSGGEKVTEVGGGRSESFSITTVGSGSGCPAVTPCPPVAPCPPKVCPGVCPTCPRCPDCPDCPRCPPVVAPTKCVCPGTKPSTQNGCTRYVSTNHIPNEWCDSNCKHTPPNCPHFCKCNSKE